jgi:hypothetical protein
MEGILMELLSIAVGAFVGSGVGAFVAWALLGRCGWTREGHDDRDYACRFWYGDREGSPNARCPVCNAKDGEPHA